MMINLNEKQIRAIMYLILNSHCSYGSEQAKQENEISNILFDKQVELEKIKCNLNIDKNF